MSYLDQLFNLKNKVVLVTGAAGQLGGLVCRAFREVDAIVIGLDLKVEENVIRGVNYMRLDITDNESIRKVYETIFNKYKRLDILINNAGVSTFEPFEVRSEEHFDWVVDVNPKGTFYCIQKMVHLYDQYNLKGGAIVNVGSIFGLVSPDFRNYPDCDRKNSEVYGATKAGIIQMTKYFAVHLADRHIRVNSVSPGGILNPKSPQGEDFQKNYAFRCPMKRMANDEEMVGAVLYLASDASSYTTGHNIVVDGGLTCW